MIPKPLKVVDAPLVLTKNQPLSNFTVAKSPELSTDDQNYYSYFPTWDSYYSASADFFSMDNYYCQLRHGLLYKESVSNPNNIHINESFLYRSNIDISYWDDFAKNSLSKKNISFYEKAIVASNPWINVYSHFLAETIYVIARSIYLNLEAPILISDHLCQPFKDIIFSLGLNPLVKYTHRDEVVAIKKLYYCPSLHAATWYGHEVPKIVNRFITARLNLQPTTSPQKRIYISRGKASARNCINEGDVCELLESYGFITVELEDFKFQDQISLFQNASIVVGAHGSGLANLIFASNQTNVIEIIPTGVESRKKIVDRSFWNLASGVPVNSYSVYYQANDPSNSGWHLDLSKFKLFLESYLLKVSR